MKNLLPIFLLVLFGFGANAQYDITTTGEFNPSTITVGNTATFDIAITNLTLTGLTVPSGSISLTVIIGSGIEVAMTSPPIGPDADKYDWTFLGNTIGWYGVSNISLPFGGVFEVEIPVEGMTISSNKSTYNSDIIAPLYDTEPLNDTGSTTITVGAILPVEFSYFGIDKINCEAAHISWRTATEVNSKGFYVERKLGNENKFEELEFVESIKSLNTENKYKYQDNIVGVNDKRAIYYRLKQVDHDGKTSFSEIIKASVNDCESKALSIFPNPTSDYINVALSNWKGTDIVSYKIVNNIGVTIYQNEEININQSRINIENYIPGMYTLFAEHNGQIFTKKFIIIK